MRAFIHDRLDNRVPLITLLWRDMYLIGTGLNLACLGLIVAALAAGLPDWLALGAILVPLPYNLFIWSAIWRVSGQMAAFACLLARALATAWLAIALLI